MSESKNETRVSEIFSLRSNSKNANKTNADIAKILIQREKERSNGGNSQNS